MSMVLTLNYSIDFDRFISYIIPESSGCWLWNGPLDRNQRPRYASRSAAKLAYLLFIGDIEKGLDLHHQCENRICVNPTHLSPVTREEHADLHGRGFCKRGHPMNGKRECYTCARERYDLRQAEPRLERQQRQQELDAQKLQAALDWAKANRSRFLVNRHNGLKKRPDQSDGLKRCGWCGTKKPFAEFSKSTNNWDGLSAHCRECSRQYKILRRNGWAGISKQETSSREALLAKGKKLCNGCNKILALEEFHINRKAKTGRASFCKSCKSKSFRTGVYKRTKDKPLAEMTEEKRTLRREQTARANRRAQRKQGLLRQFGEERLQQIMSYPGWEDKWQWDQRYKRWVTV